MVWVYVVVALFAVLAVVEWTSRPHRRAEEDEPTAHPVAYVRVPHPRTPARDTEASDGNKR